MRHVIKVVLALSVMLCLALPAFATNPATTFASSMDVLNALIAAGAPINPNYLTDFTEATDPNGLMGKSDSAYTSKTDFGCVGYKQSDPNNLIGGSVEFFSTNEACMARYKYIKAIYDASPIFKDDELYPRGNILVRISLAVNEEKTAAILSAMDKTGLPTSQIATTESPVPSEAPVTPAAAPDAAPTPQPTYEPLSNGDTGPSVARLQGRLQELGFLSGKADGDYGGQTVKAITAFQAMNSLDQTGAASVTDQSLLFSPDALNAKGKKTEVITYDENTCPVEISGIKVKTSYGYPYAQFKLKNIGQVAIKAMTYEVECYDAYGDQIVDYSDSSFVDTYSKSLAPAKSVSINTKNAASTGISGYTGTNSVRVAIIRVLLEDGTDIQYSGDKIVWYEG